MLDEKVRELQRTWTALDLAWSTPDMFHRVPLRNLSASKLTLAKLISLHESVLPSQPLSLSDTLGACGRSL